MSSVNHRGPAKSNVFRHLPMPFTHRSALTRRSSGELSHCISAKTARWLTLCPGPDPVAGARGQFLRLPEAAGGDRPCCPNRHGGALGGWCTVSVLSVCAVLPLVIGRPDASARVHRWIVFARVHLNRASDCPTVARKRSQIMQKTYNPSQWCII